MGVQWKLKDIVVSSLSPASATDAEEPDLLGARLHSFCFIHTHLVYPRLSSTFSSLLFPYLQLPQRRHMAYSCTSNAMVIHIVTYKSLIFRNVYRGLQEDFSVWKLEVLCFVTCPPIFSLVSCLLLDLIQTQIPSISILLYGFSTVTSLSSYILLFPEILCSFILCLFHAYYQGLP